MFYFTNIWEHSPPSRLGNTPQGKRRIQFHPLHLTLVALFRYDETFPPMLEFSNPPPPAINTRKTTIGIAYLTPAYGAGFFISLNGNSLRS